MNDGEELLSLIKDLETNFKLTEARITNEILPEIKRLHDKVVKNENDFNDLNRTMIQTEFTVKSISDKLDRQDKKLDTFINSYNDDREKKGDRNYDWVKYVLTTILGGCIMYVLRKLGIS